MVVTSINLFIGGTNLDSQLVSVFLKLKTQDPPIRAPVASGESIKTFKALAKAGCSWAIALLQAVQLMKLKVGNTRSNPTKYTSKPFLSSILDLPSFDQLRYDFVFSLTCFIAIVVLVFKNKTNYRLNSLNS